jgi:hypothetical protein
MRERKEKIKAGIRKGINLIKAGKINDQDDPYMLARISHSSHVDGELKSNFES